MKANVRIGSIVEFKGERYSVERVCGDSACYLTGRKAFVSIAALTVIAY